MRETIALTQVDGIGSTRANQLINHYGSADEVFKATIEDLHNEAHIPYSIAERISLDMYNQRVDWIIEWCEQNQITIIVRENKFYPPLLKQIYDPPTVLYGMGNLALLSEKSVAIIGMRKLSDYGYRATKLFTNGLCDKGLVITSGLAYGADAAAHEAALEHHGKTIAVMATGPDRIYPATHRDLAERIRESGAIISEYPPGNDVNRYQFVQRNRIVSGMSEATVVIEAGHKSGSLITANFALAQGREVFAVPGSIFSGCSEGTNELIASGATPALSVEQITTEIIGNPLHAILPTPPESEQTTLFEQNFPEYLSPNEISVLKILNNEIPKRTDELVDLLELSFEELFTILLNLEINSLIYQSCGGGYVLQ